MKIQPQTLTAVIVLAGLLASGYLIGPAPGATAGTVGGAAKPATATVLQLAARGPVSWVKASRPPVPLLVSAHSEYFVPAVDATPAQTPALVAKSDAAPDDKVVDDKVVADAAAKAMIEQDGYRDVSALAKGADGAWHARAMRGSTEIAVTVDAGGRVSAN